MKHPSGKTAAALLVCTFVAAACSPDQNESRLTTARCIELGGSIVGDIGDGRVHRPDYMCESGERPIGPIEFLEGEPIPVEAAVCCPQIQ